MSLNRRIRSLLPISLLLTSLVLVASASAARTDTAWPHEWKTSKGTLITIYEPQLESLDGDRLVGHAACSVRGGSGAEPIFGVFWFNATVKRESGDNVKLLSIDVTNAKFPDSAPEVEKSFATIVERDLPPTDLSWSADWMNETLQATKAEQATNSKLDNTPPEIVVSTEPAVLIQYDGAPQLRPMEGEELSRVVNTPYLIVFDPAGKNYYLGSDQFWYQAKDPMGPFEVIASPPSNVLALKPQEPESELPKAAVTGPPPKVFVATKPTELLVFHGEAQFRPVADTDLLYVTNCDKDVFKDVATQTDYVLLSGRWFQSKKATGPWTYVPPEKLPPSFAAIPPGSEFARVLASVPGTQQAEEAVLEAQVPQVASVQRGRTDFQVWYDEDPVFRKIEGTEIEYAVNSSVSVFRTEGKYYACDKGVWYVSDGFDGPWYVSDHRPEGLDAMPPDNPNYNTKYVYVYDSTPTDVYVGYTPGYLGCYPYHGAVYYGTGYCYDPWHGSAYYAYPWTWGLGVAYTPYAGWGFSFGFSTGFVNCGATYGYGYPSYGYPYYGGYGYCGGWYGPGGYYPVPVSGYGNPYSAGYGTTRTRTNVAAPTNIYARESTRTRSGAQVNAVNGRQLASVTGSGSRNGTAMRERSTASNGSRLTVPDRTRNSTPSGNRYSSPFRNRSSTGTKSRYSAPNGTRYERSNGQVSPRYRDGRGGYRSDSSPAFRGYDRSGAGYDTRQMRGYQGQQRGYGSQYRGMQGNQSFGRSSVGARGGYGGGAARGGGGAPRGGGGGARGGGGGGGRHR